MNVIEQSWHIILHYIIKKLSQSRADSRRAPSQWETLLQSNIYRLSLAGRKPRINPDNHQSYSNPNLWPMQGTSRASAGMVWLDFTWIFDVQHQQGSCCCYLDSFLQHNGSRCRDHFVNVPSQWETTLQCNVVSHLLGAFTKWSLKMLCGY